MYLQHPCRHLGTLAAACSVLLFALASRAPAAEGSNSGINEDARTTLSIYVSCGAQWPAFMKAIEAFRAANPTISVKGTYDRDDLLFRKVHEEGKRPDLFVSAGGRELALLAEKGLIDTSATVRLGSYKIVAVVRPDWTARVRSPRDLAGNAVRTIALPDPETTSLGWHVRQSLQKLGLWEKVRGKIQPTDVILSAYQRLLAQKADVTFTYRSCPLPKDPGELAHSRARIAFALPFNSYDEPKVCIGLLSASEHPQEARQLLAFFQSDAITSLMIAKGLPNERALGARTSIPRGAPRPATAGSGGKVNIVAFYPDDQGHHFIWVFLQKLPQRFQGRVTVSIHNIKNPDADPEGFRQWQATGFGCAGLLVNGKNTFRLGQGKKERIVTFQKRMGVAWTQQDLLDALKAELAARH